MQQNGKPLVSPRSDGVLLIQVGPRSPSEIKPEYLAGFKRDIDAAMEFFISRGILTGTEADRADETTHQDHTEPDPENAAGGETSGDPERFTDAISNKRVGFQPPDTSCT